MANLQSEKYRPNRLLRVICLSFYVILFCAGISFAQSKTIIDEWANVQPPTPPELKAVKIDAPKSTAYLVLDMVKQTCNNERRPHYVASVPNDQAFLSQDRSTKI